MDKETRGRLRSFLDAPESVKDVVEECFRENRIYWEDLCEYFTDGTYDFYITFYNNKLIIRIKKIKVHAYNKKIADSTELTQRVRYEIEVKVKFEHVNKRLLSKVFQDMKYKMKEMEKQDD